MNRLVGRGSWAHWPDVAPTAGKEDLAEVARIKAQGHLAQYGVHRCFVEKLSSHF